MSDYWAERARILEAAKSAATGEVWPEAEPVTAARRRGKSSEGADHELASIADEPGPQSPSLPDTPTND